MSEPNPKRPHILFLFSDTGGGHRSAAEAIIEGLELEADNEVSTEMVDVFKDYAPPPLNRMPDLYPRMVKVPKAWELGYHLSDGHGRARLMTSSFWPYVRWSVRKLVRQHPADLVVSVHPLALAPVLRALGKARPPFITVVTDLVTTHALWYHHRADLCLVPTEAARQRALILGMQPEKVKVVGLPVADRFCKPAGDRDALRSQLGWPQGRPTILLVGGGEGMGPLERIAYAISEACSSAALVVVAGRNQALRKRLEVHEWPIPVFIYGFVREMPDFMRAADILITKAGPGTISEAFIAGLPIVLYSRLPGQEDGNVTYVVSEGAGVWAPRIEQIVSVVKNWIDHPEERAKVASACLHLGRPQAARQIADILLEQVKVKTRP